MCFAQIVDEDQTCDGLAKNDMGECRMDMEDSELGYMGYYATEAYGLSWKVRRVCCVCVWFPWGGGERKGAPGVPSTRF